MYPILRLLVLITILPASAHAVETPKVKVLNIEPAMRAVAERNSFFGQTPRGWPARSDGVSPGAFPADCFYGEDLLSPEFATEMVERLVIDLAATPGRWLGQQATGEDLRASLAALPPIDAANHVEIFARVLELLDSHHVIVLEQGYSPGDWFIGSGSSGPVPPGAWSSAISGALADYQLNRRPFGPGDQGLEGLLPQTGQSLIWEPASPNVRPSSSLGGFMSLRYRFVYDLRGFEGAAVFEAERTEVREFRDFDVTQSTSTTATTLTESPVLGTIWRSQVYGREEWIDIPLPAVTGKGSDSVLVTTWRPKLTIVPSLTHTVDPQALFTDCEVCAACVSGCLPGTASCELGSIKVHISLGTGALGPLGELRLESEAMAASLSSRSRLKLYPQQGVRSVFDIENGIRSLRQVVTPLALVDVVTLDSHVYEVRFHRIADAGPKGADGIFQPTGAAYQVFRIENPDRSPDMFTRLRVLSSGETNETFLYSFTPTDNRWELVRTRDGESVMETRSSVRDALSETRMEDRRVVDGAGNLLRFERNTFRVFPWNREPRAASAEELVESIVDPEGAALRTAYDYYTTTGNGGFFGRLAGRLDPDGYWEKHEYDVGGRLVRSTSPFLSAPQGAVVGVRTRTIARSANLPHETTIERIVLPTGEAREVRRQYRNFSPDVVTQIVAVHPEAAWDAPENLVTVRTYMGAAAAMPPPPAPLAPPSGLGPGPGGPPVPPPPPPPPASGPVQRFAGRLQWEIRPDGTGDFHEYLVTPTGGLETRVSTGGVNGAGTGTEDGILVVTRTNAAGAVVEESRTDIATGLLLAREEAVDVDEFGRILRTNFLDGTFEERTFACCGSDYFVSREGFRTDFEYRAGRVAVETAAGIARRFTYDGLGRLTKSERVGTDGSVVRVEGRAYDLAGRIISVTDEAGRMTAYTYAAMAGGGEAVVTHLPDGATRRELRASDQAILAVDGIGTPPLAFEYGADAFGSFTTRIRIGANGSRTEWTRTHFDAAGRVSRITFPDGAEESFVFNGKGQLERRTDPDGVVELYGYNLRGEREITSVDLDRNGTIDFGGSDRILRERVEHQPDGPWTITRVLTENWPMAGDASPMLVSVEEHSTSGEMRHVENGRTTLFRTFRPSPGEVREETKAPDGTLSTRRLVDGRLLAIEASHPVAGQLSTSSLAYDAHGRVSSVSTPDGNTSLAYHVTGEVASVRTADPNPGVAGPGDDPQTAHFSYDAGGRLARTVHPDGSVTENAYLPGGQLRSTSGTAATAVEYTYDEQGRLKTLSVGGASERTEWSYNPMRGWLDRKQYPDGTAVTFEYSPSGRLRARVGARSIRTEWEYDPAGGRRAIAYSDSTPGVRFERDRLGRTVTIADAAGRVAWSYNAEGMRTLESYSGSGLLAPLSVERAGDAFGRPFTYAVAGDLPVTLDYDPASRLSRIGKGVLAASLRYRERSDLIDRLASSVIGGVEFEQTKTFDFLGRIALSELSRGGQSLDSTRNSFDAHSRRAQVSRMDGSYWAYGYDGKGQLTSARNFLANGNQAAGSDLAYAYDSRGNRTTATSGATTFVGLAQTSYTSNSSNQFISRTVPEVVDVSGTARADALVAVNSRPALREGERFYSGVRIENAQAHLLPLRVEAVLGNSGPDGEDILAEANLQVFVPQSPEMLTYDADGNLTRDGRWNYLWDAENRLVRMETRSDVAEILPTLLRLRLTFSYDFQGRRIQKRVEQWNPEAGAWALQKDLRFLYNGRDLAMEQEVAPNQHPAAARVSYVWMPPASFNSPAAGRLLFAERSNPAGGPIERQVYTDDGNGNIGAVFDGLSGNFVAEYDYDPFGKQLKATGPAAAGNPFRFATQYTDTETGLVYFGHRYYDPTTGRWLSREPLGERESPNLYRYVSNDPINRQDIVGLYEEAGHFWTVYAVAEAAGLTPDAAFRLAYYAQLPDEMPALDAVNAGLAMNLLVFPARTKMKSSLGVSSQSFARSIQQILHSLHGGRGLAAVEMRRRCLLKLASDPLLRDFERGLILHALGDSYAHTYGRVAGRTGGATESAFDAPLGHSANAVIGRDPDVIANDFDKFSRYVEALYAALGGNGRKNPALEAFLAATKSLPKDSDLANSQIADWVRSNTKFTATQYYEYNPNDGSRMLPSSSLRLPSGIEVESLLRKIEDHCCK